MTDIYYLGGEQASWRAVLLEEGVENVGISYWSWRKRRRTKLGDVDIDSYGFKGVLLDSGGHSANSKPGQLSIGDWRAYGEEFALFATEHADEVTLITEFDCLVLGPDWIKEQRRRVWSLIDPHKFLPVWHPEQGLATLEELGENYPRVAIHEKAVTGGGLNVIPHLNALARKGVQLHGVAMTKPDVLRQVSFATAASTSWISPTQYGDTIIWENNTLKRYPMKLKTVARGPRHQATMEREGFDVSKIREGDNAELTRLAIWSWRQQEAALKALHTEMVPSDRSNYTPVEAEAEDVEQGLQAVDTPDREVRSEQLVRVAPTTRPAEEMVMLPMVGMRSVDVVNDKDKSVRTELQLEVRGESARRCDTCVIRSGCDYFKAASTCAINIPVELKTKSQRAAFFTGLVEIQAQRVQFLLLVEQLNGGYPDPNLSAEYDRLVKTYQAQAELENGGSFKISIDAKGAGMGALSQLFGAGNANRANQLEQPVDAGTTDALAARIIDGKSVS